MTTHTIASSKKQIAGAIYVEMTAAGAKRKDIIVSMTQKAGLTFNGASTYYQNFKSGQWDPVGKGGGVKPTIDTETATDAELLEHFNKYSKVQLSSFVCREDAIAAIAQYC